MILLQRSNCYQIQHVNISKQTTQYKKQKKQSLAELQKIIYSAYMGNFKLQDTFNLLLILFCVQIDITNSISFEALYEKQLKTTYGFQILKHYHSEPFGNETVKKFKGQSVLFMTPWRQSGIQLSLKYLKKFDYFVPCYYDFKKSRQPDSVSLQVSQHYSEQYLQRLKEANPNIKILPRVFVHGMQGDVFFLASTEDIHMESLLNGFREIYANPFYDGVVFSSPFITPNHKYPFSMKSFLKSIRDIADQHSKLLFIVLEGVDDKPDSKISKKKARELIDLVDKVIITNYDYPKGNQGNIIPISPIPWIKQNYQFYCEVYSKAKLTPKLIMAIPLYGYFVALYGKYDPINGQQFLKKLSQEKNAWLYWHEENQECTIYLNKMEYVYFPCLHFYNTRLRYFEQINVGIAAFEAGSGLQIFMQMF